jgi:hypothetical protein
VAVRNALADLPTVGSSCLFAVTTPGAGLTRPCDFDVPVITITCLPRINTGVVMRKLFILSALLFAFVTGATATVVATTLQSESSVADTAQ